MCRCWIVSVPSLFHFTCSVLSIFFGSVQLSDEVCCSLRFNSRPGWIFFSTRQFGVLCLWSASYSKMSNFSLGIVTFCFPCRAFMVRGSIWLIAKSEFSFIVSSSWFGFIVNYLEYSQYLFFFNFFERPVLCSCFLVLFLLLDKFCCFRLYQFLYSFE